MRKGDNRVFLHVDPMDRWIRLTVLAENYGEPSNSLHEFVKKHNLRTRYNGKILYINERDYQDALENLPAERTDGTIEEEEGVPRGHAGKDRNRKIQVSGSPKRSTSIRPLETHSARSPG